MTRTVHLMLMPYGGERADAGLLSMFLCTRQRDT